MSYPSLVAVLAEQGLTPPSATDEQLKTAYLRAFQQDLPLGYEQVSKLAGRIQETGERQSVTLDPNSQEGRQFARLLGADVPRKVLQEHFGVHFGFINCCKGVGGLTKEEAIVTLREQALEQATPDC